VQKLVRAAFGNNNVDTCARVCHSPTGYGLKQTLGESAGTQTFESVMKSDVILVMGANPAAGHPVFASQIKRRVRQGAKLIVIDPRTTEMVKSPHLKADYHLKLRPGTNVAIITALAHVIVTEGLQNESYIQERCDLQSYKDWKEFVLREDNARSHGCHHRRARRDHPRRGPPVCHRRQRRDLLRPGRDRACQGSTTVMGIANLAMATGNVGREGVGVNPLRGQNNVQGSCDMGSFPHELPGYRHISDSPCAASSNRPGA
jgi:formate dehydrogenase major subunit